MLRVTKPALERLSCKLDYKDAGEGEALRFTRRKGGWSLRLDRASDRDTAFDRDGRKVLLLDEAVAKAMANMTLDTRESGKRSRLRLRRNEPRKEANDGTTPPTC